MKDQLHIEDNQTIELVEELRGVYRNVKDELHKVIVGQDEVIDHLFCSLLAGGHCIIQGVPGLAKTMIVQSLSKVLEMEFKRIQFTPDLMPSDITGSEIITENPQTHQREFRFTKGPVFANIILADEVNRTPPKTQSALLQAMQECEVTSGGKTYSLDLPFFVIATQNPIEQEGTYPLPEAALDRFMFMIYIDYPGEDEEKNIVEQTGIETPEDLSFVTNKDQILKFKQVIRTVPVSSSVIDYCVALCRATRPANNANKMEAQYVKWGASPRAGQFLASAAKTWAILNGRLTPSLDDVKRMARPILRHRIITNFNADADGITVEDIIDDLLRRVRS